MAVGKAQAITDRTAAAMLVHAINELTNAVDELHGAMVEFSEDQGKILDLLIEIKVQLDA